MCLLHHHEVFIRRAQVWARRALKDSATAGARRSANRPRTTAGLPSREIATRETQTRCDRISLRAGAAPVGSTSDSRTFRSPRTAPGLSVSQRTRPLDFLRSFL